MRRIIRFSLPDAALHEDVANDVALALFTCECIYGRQQTRLEVTYFLSGDGRNCVLSVGGDAGESATRVFTGLCEQRFGEDGFRIKRIGEDEVRP